MKDINYLLLGLIILIAISECAGQSCLKSLYANPSRTYLYFLAVLFYGIVCLLLVLSYKYKGMGLINVLWSGLSVLTIVSVGVIFYHEKLTSLDMFGIALILVGLACVLIEE
jgi:multidrug transporter EmrE-like cation transporter